LYAVANDLSIYLYVYSCVPPYDFGVVKKVVLF
jgi:hypothetical protein